METSCVAEGTYLFGEDGDVFVKGFRGAHITTCHTGLAGRTRGQFALLEDERQQREQRVPEIDNVRKNTFV